MLGRKCLILSFLALIASPALGGVLTTESFFLPSGPGNANAAPTMDMILGTNPLTAWGEKGAVGLQGSGSVNMVSGTTTPPPADVTFKFNVGATVDSLNTTYGAGNWTIANPQLIFQYTYYANNLIFGGGGGSFETYWVANDTWQFGNGPSAGNSYGDNQWVSGKDPAYATDSTSLSTWAGTEADLGSTTYNWLSPGSNPNYAGWVTDKTGKNQGMLTDNLTADPLLVQDITAATNSSNPGVSLYLIPTSSSLGLTIFTGGGNVTPELTFQVVSVPEPGSLAVAAVAGVALLKRRTRTR